MYFFLSFFRLLFDAPVQVQVRVSTRVSRELDAQSCTRSTSRWGKLAVGMSVSIFDKFLSAFFRQYNLIGRSMFTNTGWVDLVGFCIAKNHIFYDFFNAVEKCKTSYFENV